VGGLTDLSLALIKWGWVKGRGKERKKVRNDSKIKSLLHRRKSIRKGGENFVGKKGENQFQEESGGEVKKQRV